MKKAPFTASEMSDAARRFLYACAFWAVAADEELKPAEQAWLVEQFGEEGCTRSLEEFVKLGTEEFFQAFDGAAAVLAAEEKHALFAELEAWLLSCVEADGAVAPVEKETICQIKARLGIRGGARAQVNAPTAEEFVSGDEVGVFEGHASEVVCVAVSPDGHTIASGADDGTVILWDMGSRKELRRLPGHELGVGGVVFAREGRHLITADRMGVLRDWDLETGLLVWDVRRRREGGLTALALSPDGARIAGTSDVGRVSLWSIDGREQMTFGERRAGAVRTVSFSPDGRWLATGGDDQKIHVWDAGLGSEARLLSGHKDGVLSVCFSPDGARLLSGSRDGSVGVWRADGTESRMMGGHTFIVQQVCFVGGSRCGASAAWDHTVRLWDLASGRLLFTLESDASRFTCLGACPDGANLLAGGSDKLLHQLRLSGPWV